MDGGRHLTLALTDDGGHFVRLITHEILHAKFN